MTRPPILSRLPFIAAAVLVVSTGGAVTGMAVAGPILGRAGETRLPTQPIVASDPRVAVLPDHYPLHTRDGVVEVGELALRGRLHGSARPWWTDDTRATSVPGSAEDGEFNDAERPAQVVEGAAGDDLSVPTRAVDIAPVVKTTYAETPLTLAEPPAPAFGAAPVPGEL